MAGLHAAQRAGLGAAAVLAALALESPVAGNQPQPGAAQTGVHGTWINPKRTVTVVTSPCGKLLCGAIVSATAEVQQIASKAGAPPLIGTRLLRDYRQTGKDRWQGTVFVPDRNESYYSTIKQIDADHLKISGCILGGLLCKSQIWQRTS